MKINNVFDLVTLLAYMLAVNAGKFPVRDLSELVHAIFPDCDSIKPGEWSQYMQEIELNNDVFQIGVYREPLNGDEYEGTLSLQAALADIVIFCQEIPKED